MDGITEGEWHVGTTIYMEEVKGKVRGMVRGTLYLLHP